MLADDVIMTLFVTKVQVERDAAVEDTSAEGTHGARFETDYLFLF